MRLTLSSLVCLSLSAHVGLAIAAPTYSITQLGFTDAEHTRSNGSRSSVAFGPTESGYVRGGSSRYNGGNVDLGFSSWVYDGTNTTLIGLEGLEYTRSDGLQNVVNSQMNEAGQVRGFSTRYNGTNLNLGSSAWIYDGASTVHLGFTGSEYTAGNGTKVSTALDMNEAGQVIGFSSRYNGGNTSFGSSAWLYDGLTTVEIGYTDGDHLRGDGLRTSNPVALNEAGEVSGWSDRYVGGGGRSAWLHDSGTTTIIGLTDADHTRSDGFRFSQGGRVNEAGQVAGYSNRYIGGSTLNSQLDQSAWLYDGATTINIGLTGGGFVGTDGNRFSDADGINEAGQVIGFSYRYSGNSREGGSAWLYDGATTIPIGLVGGVHPGSTAQELTESGKVRGTSGRRTGGSLFGSYLGTSAWVYDGVNTIQLGFTGAQHTNGTDFKVSETTAMNEAGDVIGYSNRYTAGGGKDSWLYDGTTTRNVALVGGEYANGSGFQNSEAQQINEAGQVIGFSLRANGGQDAWLYDPTLDDTFRLRLSERSDGFASSTATYLGEDGLVLGTYTLFDGLDNSLGTRAFYFTLEDGLHDLGALVDGGLAANGWQWLASAVRENGLGQIVGSGRPSSQSTAAMAFLLTPVPEPGALALCLIAAGCIPQRPQRARRRGD